MENTMRPAGRAETESLYFTYPHFEPPKGQARAHLRKSQKVAIVGAGPIGMTAALTLGHTQTSVPESLLQGILGQLPTCFITHTELYSLSGTLSLQTPKTALR